MKRDTCVLAFVLLAVTIGNAQSQPPVIRATTEGVVLDVTVLDNQGQPILDLTPADFEVKEAGKVQQVLSAPVGQIVDFEHAGNGTLAFMKV